MHAYFIVHVRIVEDKYGEIPETAYWNAADAEWDPIGGTAYRTREEAAGPAFLLAATHMHHKGYVTVETFREVEARWGREREIYEQAVRLLRRVGPGP